MIKKRRLKGSGSIRFKRSSILVRFLLSPVKLTILVGELVVWVVKLPRYIVYGIWFMGKTLLLLPVSLILHFSHPIRRHRGRPRTQPFFTFYKKRSIKLLDRIFPKPLRIAAVLVVVLTTVFIYSLALINIAHALPSPDELTQRQEPLTSEIYDRNGKLLYRFYEGKNRQLVKLEQVPKTLIQATIASEDKNFFNHHGVDPFGIARALRTNFFPHDPSASLQGGSTITQQLIKNTLLTPDQTFSRKFKEVLLAFWAERIFSKNQILKMYFNNVPYGGPAWGVKAASLMYFGKNVEDLNLAEAAFLAGLPAAPTIYSPYGTNPDQGKLRQKQVLDRMVEVGFIKEDQAKRAFETELAFKNPTIDIKAPHFVMFVRSILSQRYGENAVSQGGLKVITTLDLNIQEMAERAVLANVEKLVNLGVSNGAAMVTQSKTGQVLAMVGSKKYWDSSGGNFNATLALRSPGSSIKVLTYATAFKQGFTPGTVLIDAPTTFEDGVNSYSPINYDGSFHGAVTIRKALANSYNVPAVKTLSIVGLGAVVETARDLGISSWDNPHTFGLSLTLGGAPVKLLEMMSVYGALADLGVRHNLNPILQVVDSSGKVLEDHQNDPGKRVLTPQIAYLVTHILADNKARVPAFGEHSLLEIKDHTVPVKTGTSDWKRDNLAFGYTPEYVVGTWVGNFDNSPMRSEITSGITGATPIWHDIMSSLLEDQPDLAFERPRGIIEDPQTHDLAISGQLPKTVTAYKEEKKKDDAGKEKLVVTYTDQFGSINADKSATPQKSN